MLIKIEKNEYLERYVYCAQYWPNNVQIMYYANCPALLGGPTDCVFPPEHNPALNRPDIRNNWMAKDYNR